MEIRSFSNNRGPSICSRYPVFNFELGGVEQLPYIGENSAFFIYLNSWLPNFAIHFDLCRASESSESTPETTRHHICHVFEHLNIELQIVAGNDVACVRQGLTPPDLVTAVVTYEEEEVCIAAAEFACEVINALRPVVDDADAAPAVDFDFKQRLDEFVISVQRHMLPVQDRVLLRTARARNIPATRLVGRLVVLGQGRYQQRFNGSKTSLSNSVSNDIAANKDHCRRLLGQFGLPVPSYGRAYRSRSAVELAQSIGFPVVVKPNNGQMGRGVSVGVKNRRETRAAYKRAREFCRSVLVEEMVPGADYRMLVINGELCAAAKRVPGHVVGDGVQTIEELVAELNGDPRRGKGPQYSWSKIEIDEQAERLLAELDYTLQSIPEKGVEVYLRRNANTSDGGTAVDVTDIVHSDNRDIAIHAAKAVGLDIAGVDFLIADISKSMYENGGVICEINSRPGLRKHMWPAEGKRRDVTGPIIDMLYPPGSRTRIKSMVVTGNDVPARAEIARLLAGRLAQQGYSVGFAVEGLVYINGKEKKCRPLTHIETVRMLVLDPDIEAVILALDPQDICPAGFGLDSCDICIVINATSTADLAATAPNSSPPDAELIQAIANVAARTLYVEDPDDSASVRRIMTECLDILPAVSGLKSRGWHKQPGNRALDTAYTTSN